MVAALLAVLSACMAPTPVQASLPEDSSTTSFTVTLSQDPAFGFTPSVTASIGLSDDVALTVYGVFWTQDALAGNEGGLGLYTEFGAGCSLTLMDGALNVSPAIGISSGKFHSGGGRPVFGDGIVPTLVATWTSGAFSVTLGSVSWLHLRREAAVTPRIDLYDVSATAAVTITRHLATGILFDHLLQTITTPGCTCPTTSTAYQWIGPFIRFTVNSGASITVAAGIDLVDYRNDPAPEGGRMVRDFYKLQASMPW